MQHSKPTLAMQASLFSHFIHSFPAASKPAQHHLRVAGSKQPDPTSLFLHSIAPAVIKSFLSFYGDIQGEGALSLLPSDSRAAESFC